MLGSTRADAAIEQVLPRACAEGDREDGRLAFDMLRWRESQEERRQNSGCCARRTVEEKRAGVRTLCVEHTAGPLDEAP